MLSQQELADRAGVSLFTVQRIERGEGSVRPKTGRAIAAALGVGVEDLLGKAQPPLPDFEDGAEDKGFDSPARSFRLPVPGDLEQRRSNHAAMMAWSDYLTLTLRRWEQLRRRFRDLATREPDEDRDAEDLYRALADSREFFMTVDRICTVAGGFDLTRFEPDATDFEGREVLWVAREQADRLRRVFELFYDYSERLTEAIEARQSAWAQKEVEKFLEEVTKEEARTVDVR